MAEEEAAQGRTDRRDDAEAMARLQEEINNLPVSEHLVFMLQSLSSLAVDRLGLAPEAAARRDPAAGSIGHRRLQGSAHRPGAGAARRRRSRPTGACSLSCRWPMWERLGAGGAPATARSVAATEPAARAPPSRRRAAAESLRSQQATEGSQAAARSAKAAPQERPPIAGGRRHAGGSRRAQEGLVIRFPAGA